MPVFRPGAHLEPALMSLLAQTHRDFALVVVDDASKDGTVECVKALAAGDPRVEVQVNPRRLGMLANTRRAFGLALERQPGAELVALTSDHDIWEPAWLEQLVTALDERPQAVLAYPLSVRIDAAGSEVAAPRQFETRGVDDAGARLRRAALGMIAGEMVYGLVRGRALPKGPPLYRGVLYPDRLLMAELALAGEFVQVPNVLWRRRILSLSSPGRQRRALWPEDPPLHSRMPYSLVHAAVLLRLHGPRRALLDFLPASAMFETRTRATRRAYLIARKLLRPMLDRRGT